jgi:hypothetical protein
MEFLNQIAGFLVDKQFSVSIAQVAALMIFLSLCLLWGKNKLGLMGSYIFVAYWGFMENRASFLSLFGEPTVGMYAYVILSFIFGAVALVSLFRSDD